MGCSFPISRSSLSSSCAGLKNKTLSLLMGPGVDANVLTAQSRVGVFGNTLPTDETQWIPVMVDNPPSVEPGATSSSVVPGVCTNMVLSLHVEVAHAAAGSLADPQQKVVGVRYRFGAPADVRADAGGSRVQVSASVAFLDVSEPAVDRFKDFPVIEARLPYDFFYPFVTDGVTNSADKPLGNANVFMLATFLAIVWRVTFNVS